MDSHASRLLAQVDAIARAAEEDLELVEKVFGPHANSIVYGCRGFDAMFVFLRKEDAIWHEELLWGVSTWGELRERYPDIYQQLGGTEYADEDDCNLADSDDFPFPDDRGAWSPRDGHRFVAEWGYFSEPVVRPDQVNPLVRFLGSRGFSCERDDELVQRAFGSND